MAFDREVRRIREALSDAKAILESVVDMEEEDSPLADEANAAIIDIENADDDLDEIENAEVVDAYEIGKAISNIEDAVTDLRREL